MSEFSEIERRKIENGVREQLLEDLAGDFFVAAPGRRTATPHDVFKRVLSFATTPRCRFIGDRTQREIAAALGESEQAFSKRLEGIRAVRELRKNERNANKTGQPCKSKLRTSSASRKPL